jgi:predicted Zn-dependent protease
MNAGIKRAMAATSCCAVAVALGIFAGCTSDPLGGSHLNFMSRDQEIQLGQQGYQEVLAQYGEYTDNPALTAHVDSIGQAIAKISDDPSFPYKYTILDATEVNAFALPGGPVFITRGLLAYIQNDAQLAMILGHETGHIVEHHTARMYTSAQLTNLAVGIGSILVPQVRPYLGAVQVGLQLLFLKYSRGDEEQADELGVKYATKLGYDASNSSRFFETLELMQQQAGISLPEWQSTHPDPGNRKVTVVSLAAKYRQQFGTSQEQLKGLDSSYYLPMVNNIVFGENPRHGFVSGSTYYNPDLRFQMPVPSGWAVANFATQVQMAPNTESPNAGIVLALGGSGVTPVNAANQFVSQNNASVVENGATTVNGYQAYRLVSTINVDDGNGGTAVLEALSYFISKDGQLYVIHGYTTQGNFSSYRNTFESVAQGFMNVTNSEVLNVQPFRLQVFQAPRTDQLQNLVQLNANAGIKTTTDAALLNEKNPTDQIPAGGYLKQVK